MKDGPKHIVKLQVVIGGLRCFCAIQGQAPIREACVVNLARTAHRKPSPWMSSDALTFLEVLGKGKQGFAFTLHNQLQLHNSAALACAQECRSTNVLQTNSGSCSAGL